MTSIKNAEAVHALGMVCFFNVPEITESSDAYAMSRAMWDILDKETADPEKVDLRLRITTFVRAHDLKRPR